MNQDELVDTLAGLTLFSDLGRPQLAEAAHTFTEEAFPAGQRILRQGFKGTGFYVILEGEVVVRIDGEDRARLQHSDAAVDRVRSRHAAPPQIGRHGIAIERGCEIGAGAQGLQFGGE